MLCKKGRKEGIKMGTAGPIYLQKRRRLSLHATQFSLLRSPLLLRICLRPDALGAGAMPQRSSEASPAPYEYPIPYWYGDSVGQRGYGLGKGADLVQTPIQSFSSLAAVLSISIQCQYCHVSLKQQQLSSHGSPQKRPVATPLSALHQLHSDDTRSKAQDVHYHWVPSMYTTD